jgi:hypothetical protein
VILPPLVFPGSTSKLFDVRAIEQMSFRGKFWRLFRRIFTKKNIEGEDIGRIYKLNGFGGKRKKRECFEKLKSVKPNRTINTRIQLIFDSIFLQNNFLRNCFTKMFILKY